MENSRQDQDVITAKALADINSMCKGMAAQLEDMTQKVAGMSREQAAISVNLDKSLKRLRISSAIFAFIFIVFIVSFITISTLGYLKYQSAKDAISHGITTLHEKAESAKPLFKSLSLTKSKEE